MYYYETAMGQEYACAVGGGICQYWMGCCKDAMMMNIMLCAPFLPVNCPQSFHVSRVMRANPSALILAIFGLECVGNVCVIIKYHNHWVNAVYSAKIKKDKTKTSWPTTVYVVVFVMVLLFPLSPKSQSICTHKIYGIYSRYSSKRIQY